MPSTSLTLKVGYLDGGEVTVTAYLAELVEFERRYDLPMGVLMDPTQRRIEHMLFVAWSAAKRAGETREFDDWMTQVIEVGTVAEVDADPLDLTPPTD